MGIELRITTQYTVFRFPEHFTLHPRTPDGFLVRALQQNHNDEDMDWVRYEMRDKFYGMDFALWYDKFKKETTLARHKIEHYLLQQSSFDVQITIFK